MKRYAPLLLLLLFLFGSCASARTAYKCTGARGQRVPMGVL